MKQQMLFADLAEDHRICWERMLIHLLSKRSRGLQLPHWEKTYWQSVMAHTNTRIISTCLFGTLH